MQQTKKYMWFLDTISKYVWKADFSPKQLQSVHREQQGTQEFN